MSSDGSENYEMGDVEEKSSRVDVEGNCNVIIYTQNVWAYILGL